MAYPCRKRSTTQAPSRIHFHRAPTAGSTYVVGKHEVPPIPDNSHPEASDSSCGVVIAHSAYHQINFNGYGPTEIYKFVLDNCDLNVDLF
jgi:hypothetical protein